MSSHQKLSERLVEWSSRKKERILSNFFPSLQLFTLSFGTVYGRAARIFFSEMYFYVPVLWSNATKFFRFEFPQRTNFHKSPMKK